MFSLNERVPVKCTICTLKSSVDFYHGCTGYNSGKMAVCARIVNAEFTSLPGMKLKLDNSNDNNNEKVVYWGCGRCTKMLHQVCGLLSFAPLAEKSVNMTTFSNNISRIRRTGQGQSV